MSDEEYILENILERVEFLEDNVEDLTTEEKIMQLRLIATDLSQIKNLHYHKVAAAHLMGYAVNDHDCQVHFQLFYPKEVEDEDITGEY